MDRLIRRPDGPVIHTIFLMAALALLVILSSCEEEADLYQTFVIRKGEHYATTRKVQMLQSTKLSFEAVFDRSAIYHFETRAEQDAKNKLLGFSDCNSLHHQNSARFAWQWFDEELEIYAYCYVNGERVEKFVGTVELNEVNHYEIRLTNNEYVFFLNGYEPVRIERSPPCTTGAYYMLWPYFGGSLPAPHQVNIRIKLDY